MEVFYRRPYATCWRRSFSCPLTEHGIQTNCVIITCNRTGKEFLLTNLFGLSVLSSFVLVNIT